MRVSTADFFTRGLASMQLRQQELARVQRQLGSGLRLENPVDDPSGAADVNRFSAALASSDAFGASIERINTALSSEEGALGTAGDVLNRIRELTLQGLSASQSTDSRRAIAVEVRALRSQLVALGNSRGADGEFMFAGYSVGAPPFQEVAGVVSYVGDAGQRTLEIDPGNSIAMGDPGSSVFLGGRAGNGTFTTSAGAANGGTLRVGATAVTDSFVPDDYTVTFAVAPDGATSFTVTGAVSGLVASGSYAPGDTLVFAGARLDLAGTPANGDSLTVAPSGRLDIFAALDELADSLESSGTSPAAQTAVTNRLGQALNNLDQQLGHLSSLRASVGSRLKAAEVMADAHAGSTLQVQQALSNVRDLDYAEAATRLSQNLTALQAAQEAFGRLANLSLFNFLR